MKNLIPKPNVAHKFLGMEFGLFPFIRLCVVDARLHGNKYITFLFIYCFHEHHKLLRVRAQRNACRDGGVAMAFAASV